LIVFADTIYNDEEIKGPEDEANEEQLTFPAVTMFELNLDSTLRKMFLDQLFLEDCSHRGFISKTISEENLPFSVYFDSCELILSKRVPIIEETQSKSVENSSTVAMTNSSTSSSSCRNSWGVLVLKCENSRVLFGVKKSIFKRLASLPECNIRASVDETFCDSSRIEKLYHIGFALDEMRASFCMEKGDNMKNDGEKIVLQSGDVMGSYLEIRDIAEAAIKYLYVTNVE